MLVSFIRLFFVFLFVLYSQNIAFSEIFMDADSISYDSENDIISASGNVVVTQIISQNKKRVLNTNKIQYNRKTRQINLIGNSKIKEYTGDVISGSDIEIDEDFKKGIINSMKIVFNDKSHVHAKTAKKNGNIFTFENASYSPCYENEKCSHTLWDLLADDVIYDDKKKTFTYRHVRFRIKGHSILYFPYFSHPSFTIKRTTGFLTPIISSNNDTGKIIGIPYYMVLGNDRDLKITPFIMFRNRGLLSSEYRQLFYNGDLFIGGSILSRSKNKNIHIAEQHNRWHTDISWKSYNLDNKQLFIRLNRVSDMTYLSKYPVDRNHNKGSIVSKKSTESKIVFDKFDDNYFMTLSGHVFQTTNHDADPKIFPSFKFNKKQTNVLDGILYFDNKTTYLNRKNNEIENQNIYTKNMLHTNNKLSWNRNIIKYHSIFDIYSSLGCDIYYHNNKHNNNKQKNLMAPIIENSLSWKMPFKAETIFHNKKCIVSPKISFTSVMTSHDKKYSLINEDSIFDNFDDLKIFSMNRYGNMDRIDNSDRISIGLENEVYDKKRRNINFFIGRSITLKNRNIDIREKKSSENVARIIWQPSDSITFRSRSIGIPYLEKVSMFEMGSSLKIHNIILDGAYFFDKRKNKILKNMNDTSLLGISIGYNLNQNWNIITSTVFDMKNKHANRNITRGLFLKYKNECLEFACGIYKSKYHDQDIKPKSGFSLSFNLKNIGGISESENKYIYNSIISH